MFIEQAHAAVGDGSAHAVALGGAGKSRSDATRQHQMLRAVKASPPLAIAMKPDPTTAKGVAGPGGNAAAGGGMLPGGIHGQLAHLKPTDRRLPAGPAHPHRETAPFTPVLDHGEPPQPTIEHQLALGGGKGDALRSWRISRCRQPDEARQQNSPKGSSSKANNTVHQPRRHLCPLARQPPDLLSR